MNCILIFYITVLSFFAQPVNWQIIDADLFEQYLQIPTAVVVDARYLDDYKYIRISNAKSVHKSELLNELAQNLDKEQYILIYCFHKVRCIAVADYFIENGFVNVFVLDSTFDDWVQAGKPIDDRKLSRKEIKLLK